jgi:hypothetical protein
MPSFEGCNPSLIAQRETVGRLEEQLFPNVPKNAVRNGSTEDAGAPTD